MRCKGIWIQRYPTEPFENEFDSDSEYPDVRNEDLLIEVMKQRFLCRKFSEPYMSELVYLIAARKRYKGFLCILQRCADGCPRLVPAADISLLWLTHQVDSFLPCFLSLFFLLSDFQLMRLLANFFNDWYYLFEFDTKIPCRKMGPC